ncbi:hypothetical protein BH10PSE7_BH10PSE7_23010 [soil metagenome]
MKIAQPPFFVMFLCRQVVKARLAALRLVLLPAHRNHGLIYQDVRKPVFAPANPARHASSHGRECTQERPVYDSKVSVSARPQSRTGGKDGEISQRFLLISARCALLVVIPGREHQCVIHNHLQKRARLSEAALQNGSQSHRRLPLGWPVRPGLGIRNSQGWVSPPHHGRSAGRFGRLETSP